MRALILAALVAAIATPAIAGRGKQVRYVGIHPVPKAHGGGFCEIEGPHVHVFAANKLEYRLHGDDYFFVGDPIAYGYAGPRYAYKGHHPIHVDAVVGDDTEDLEFCYLDGPHYHSFVPAIEADFKVVGDTYFYVAEPPAMYVEAKPALVKINAMYTPLRYARPVVTVEAPRGWIGVRYAAPAVRAEVIVPAPSLELNIGIGAGVIIDGHHHHHRHPGRGHGHHKHKHKKHKRHRHW